MEQELNVLTMPIRRAISRLVVGLAIYLSYTAYLISTVFGGEAKVSLIPDNQKRPHLKARYTH